MDRETAGVQNHLVDNDLHVVLGERAKWNAAYDHSQNTNMHNAYSSFSFKNAISTYAAEPEDPTDSTPTDFNVSAQTSNHQLKFIAANNLIEFNASDTRNSDEVEITIHADPEGAADEAEANAKAYADSIKNDLLNGAGAAYDTLKELGELIDENHDAITALEEVATNKADKNHTHDATNLNFSSKNTYYTNASNIQDAIEDIDSKMWDVTGELDQVAETFSIHEYNSNIHMSEEEKDKLTTAYEYSQTTHNMSSLNMDAVPYIILQSPNGTKFKLEVDNNGILTTTKMSSIDQRPDPEPEEE